MTRTTPPRPVDIAAAFPALAPLARRAVRLHPRPGAPTVHDSSVGGPLLWPADEPWPVCAGPHAEQDEGGDLPVSLGDVRRRRELWKAEPGPERNAALDATYDGHPWSPGPNAMLPVVQLYARDVPALPRPDGADLLQVLWCPLDHDPEWMPATRPVWRSSAAVDRPLAAPPEPADLSHYGQYLAEPCLLHPEEVTEYPAPLELDPALRQRIADHCEHAHPGLTRHSYQEELSVAPGWKLGGWGPWSFRDPEPLGCADCGAAMLPLLTIASGGVRDGNSWDPVEDTGPDRDLGVMIGRGYHLQLHRCPASFEHPHREVMQ